MKVVFLQTDGANQVDDMKNVKSGYARYLFRYKKAAVATPALIAEAEKRMAERIKQLEKTREEARKVANKMQDIILEFTEKADQNHLYGSINEKMIAEELTKASKIEIKPEQIRMGEHIKTVGEHQIKVHLVDKVDAHITVLVNMTKPEWEEKKEKEEEDLKKTKAKRGQAEKESQNKEEIVVTGGKEDDKVEKTEEKEPEKE